METKESKDIELNILIFERNQEFKKVLEEEFQKIIKEYPNLHTYIIVSNQEEELQKLKDIKMDIVCTSPFFVKYLPYTLKNFQTIKWVHSLSAGVEDFFQIDEISKNENLIFSNSKGSNSEVLGELGITAMMYFSYNLISPLLRFNIFLNF